jgi:hypothetical protein
MDLEVAHGRLAVQEVGDLSNIKRRSVRSVEIKSKAVRFVEIKNTVQRKAYF